MNCIRSTVYTPVNVNGKYFSGDASNKQVYTRPSSANNVVNNRRFIFGEHGTNQVLHYRRRHQHTIVAHT